MSSPFDNTPEDEAREVTAFYGALHLDTPKTRIPWTASLTFLSYDEMVLVVNLTAVADSQGRFAIMSAETVRAMFTEGLVRFIVHHAEKCQYLTPGDDDDCPILEHESDGWVVSTVEGVEPYDELEVAAREFAKASLDWYLA